MTYLLVFGVALALSIGLTYRVRAWALRAGIVDRPDDVRRWHSGAIPRVGGIGVYLSVAAAVILAWMLGAPLIDPSTTPLGQFIGLVAGGTAIFLLGLSDDIRGGLRARTKFLVEIGVAVAIFLLGVRIEGIALPGGGAVEFPYAVSLLVSTLWVVGVTNAFNLIDGSDGVAGGAAVFAAGAMVTVSILNGHVLGATIALALAGGTIGFLFFNFPPASIFLGDSGSLFLGFMLAALGVSTTQTAQTALAVAIPVVSCGLPILDTLLAMARRLLRGESMFSPDRGHIHHRLRDLGHSPRRVALILYLVSAAFALLSLVLVHPSGPVTAALFVAAGAALWIGVQRLHIPELVEVGRMLERGARQRVAIAHNVRLREAVTRLEGARDAAAVLRALAFAFETSEFRRVELWLAEEVAAPLAGLGVTCMDGMCRWECCGGSGAADGRHWELRLPFRDADGRVIGRISLWHDLEEDRPFTDLRLIAVELQPELLRALARIRASDADREAVPDARAVETVPARTTVAS